MLQAGGVYSELVLDTSKYNDALEKADKQMKSFEKNLVSAGESMTKAGKSWTAKVTTPILGLGAAATKVGLDFDAGMSQVKAISGATGEELARLEAKAKEMGATTKFSASQSAEALKYMAMAGWETTDMIEGLDGVMLLAAASGEDLGTVSDIVTDSMTAFGLAANQAGRFADVLAAASSSSNTNVGIMGETFKYVAPLAGSLGYSIEDTALAVGLMANAGIKGSQAGTALRGMLTRLVKPTRESADAMAALGIEMTNTDGTLKPLTQVMEELRVAFKDLTPEQKALRAAQIAGQEAMSGFLAVVNASDDDFSKLQSNIKNSTGAAKEMSDIMEDNLKGRWTKFMSGVEGAALQISDLLLPTLEKWLAKGQAFIDWFAALDDGTKQTIIQIAGFAAAIGPALLIGGKFATSIGSIAGLFTKFSAGAATATTATAAMGTQIGTASAAAKAGALLFNPWTLGIGAAGLAAYGLAKHLQQDAIPAVELFTDEISENTKVAVGSFLDLEKEATSSLNRLAWSGAEVTEDMKTELVGNFDAMKNEVVTKLQEQKEAAIVELEELFSNSINISEEEKNEMVRIAEEKYDEQIKKAEEGNARILEILEQAKEDGLGITEERKKEIERITEEMKDTAIRILSESEEEQLIILERLRIESDKITAQMAVDVVKNSIEQKEKSIAAAEEQYKEMLRHAVNLRADGSKESEKLADKIIEEAQRQKEEAVKAAEEMHNKIVNEAKNQAREHVEQINWETGEVKTKWESLKEWFMQNPIIRRIFTVDDEKSQTGSYWGVSSSEISNIGKNARGTNYWRGGLTWVGEEGPELIDLPRGSKVFSNQKSMDMAGSEGNINNSFVVHAVIKEEADIKKLAKELHQLQQEDSRGRGLTPIW